MANRIVFQAKQFRLIEISTEIPSTENPSMMLVQKTHVWEYKQGVDLLGADRWDDVKRNTQMVCEVLTAMLISGELKQGA